MNALTSMLPQTVADPTAISLLMIAVSALTGALICLFVWFRTEYNACRIREEKCTEQHIALLERVARLEVSPYSNNTR